MLNKVNMERAKQLFHNCVNHPDPEKRTIVGYIRDKNRNPIGMGCCFIGEDGLVYFRWSKLHHKDSFNKYEGFCWMLDPNKDSIIIDDVYNGNMKNVPSVVQRFLQDEMLPRAQKYFRLSYIDADKITAREIQLLEMFGLVRCGRN